LVFVIIRLPVFSIPRAVYFLDGIHHCRPCQFVNGLVAEFKARREMAGNVLTVPIWVARTPLHWAITTDGTRDALQQPRRADLSRNVGEITGLATRRDVECDNESRERGRSMTRLFRFETYTLVRYHD
jgi:hypothetical protein